jgi:hypothetical protein
MAFRWYRIILGSTDRAIAYHAHLIALSSYSKESAQKTFLTKSMTGASQKHCKAIFCHLFRLHYVSGDDSDGTSNGPT